MALTAASFRDPEMRDSLQAYYDKMTGDAIAGLRARPEQTGGTVNMRMPDGTEREMTVIPISAERMEKALVSFDQWLDIQSSMFARYEERAEMLPRAGADGMAHDFVYEGWQANVENISAFLVSLQEVDASEGAGGEVDVGAYDFTDMTRQEIADAGMELFRAGKITLDELFRFEHPDGRLRVDENGGEVTYNPFEKMNFVGLLTQMMRDMEATGEALRADSGYSVFAGLLEKLEGWQGADAQG